MDIQALKNWNYDSRVRALPENTRRAIFGEAFEQLYGNDDRLQKLSAENRLLAKDMFIDDISAPDVGEETKRAFHRILPEWGKQVATGVEAIGNAAIIAEEKHERAKDTASGWAEKLFGKTVQPIAEPLQTGEGIRDVGQAAKAGYQHKLDQPDIVKHPGAQIDLWEKPSDILNPVYWGPGMVELTSSLVPTLAAYATGGKIAGTVVGGYMEATGLYDELVKEGVPQEGALTAAVGFGAIVGMLNMIPIDRIAKGGEKGIKSFIKRILINSPLEGITESMEEPIGELAKSLARGDDLPTTVENIKEGAKRGVSVFPLAAATGAGMTMAQEAATLRPKFSTKGKPKKQDFINAVKESVTKDDGSIDKDSLLEVAASEDLYEKTGVTGEELISAVNEIPELTKVEAKRSDLSPLIGMIKEGLKTGELNGEPFSAEIAREMMAEAEKDNVITVKDVAELEDRFPELRSPERLYQEYEPSAPPDTKQGERKAKEIAKETKAKNLEMDRLMAEIYPEEFEITKELVQKYPHLKKQFQQQLLTVDFINSLRETVSESEWNSFSDQALNRLRALNKPEDSPLSEKEWIAQKTSVLKALQDKFKAKPEGLVPEAETPKEEFRSERHVKEKSDILTETERDIKEAESGIRDFRKKNKPYESKKIALFDVVKNDKKAGIDTTEYTYTIIPDHEGFGVRRKLKPEEIIKKQKREKGDKKLEDESLQKWEDQKSKILKALQEKNKTRSKADREYRYIQQKMKAGLKLTKSEKTVVKQYESRQAKIKKQAEAVRAKLEARQKAIEAEIEEFEKAYQENKEIVDHESLKEWENQKSKALKELREKNKITPKADREYRYIQQKKKAGLSLSKSEKTFVKQYKARQAKIKKQAEAVKAKLEARQKVIEAEIEEFEKAYQAGLREPRDPRRRHIPPSLDNAFELMKEQVASGETKQAVIQEDGTTIPTPSTYPDWFKQKQKGVFEGKWSKREFNILMKKAETGQSFTKKQQARFNELERVAQYLNDNDLGLAKTQDYEDIEKRGFNLVGQEMAVGHFDKGDKVILKEGQTTDEYEHKGYDKEGNAIFEDGETKKLDPFEMLDVEAVKKAKGKIEPISEPIEPIEPMPEEKISTPASQVGAIEQILSSEYGVEGIDNEWLYKNDVYVHGRTDSSQLSDGGLVLVTQDMETAFQYGRDGSIHFFKEPEKSKIMDLSSERSSHMDAVVKKAVSDRMFTDYLQTPLDDKNGQPIDVNDLKDSDVDKLIESATREAFSPEDIVDSAGGFDNPDFFQWFYDNFGNKFDFVKTPDGGVVLNPANIAREYIPYNEKMESQDDYGKSEIKNFLKVEKISEGGVTYEVQSGKTETLRAKEGSGEVRDKKPEQLTIFTVLGEKPQKKPITTYPHQIGAFSFDREFIRNADDAAHVLAPLRKRAKETVVVLTLDADRKPVSVIQHSTGGPESSRVYASELMGSIANTQKAKYFWLSHNHPSGDVTASAHDISLTKGILNLAENTGKVFEGQVIIGSTGQYLSLTPEGFIDEEYKEIPSKKKGDQKVKVVESRLKGDFHEFADKTETSITSTDMAIRVISELSKGKPGVTLLDAKNMAVKWVSIPVAKMKALRESGTAEGIYKIIGKQSGISKSIINLKKENKEALTNAVFFLEALNVPAIDIIIDGKVSLLSEGRVQQYRPETGARSAFYSKDTGKTGGSTVEQVKTFIQKALGKKRTENLLKSGHVKIVSSQKDLPEGAETSGDYVINGAFASDGTIYLVAGNLNKANTYPTLLHEALHAEHAQNGWKGLFGKNYSVYESVKAQYEQMLETKHAGLMAAHKQAEEAGVAAEHMFEETLAYFVTNTANHKTSLFRRILHAVRAWAVRAGLKKNVTADDMVALAEAAIRRQARGSSETAEKRSGKSNALYSKEKDTFTPEEIKIAAQTSRATGAIGGKAITPRYVSENLKPGDTILNFGAGKVSKQGVIPHSQVLEEKGAHVTNYDFSANRTRKVHDPNALMKQYDIVMASNVLNVQSSLRMLENTLDQLSDTMKDTGRIIANFPISPRKTDLTARQLQTILEKRFVTKMVGGTKSAPLFELTRLNKGSAPMYSKTKKKSYQLAMEKYQKAHTTPLVEDLIKKIQSEYDPVNTEPEKIKSFIKSIPLLPKRFRSEVLTNRDMKWYHKTFETPYVLAKKFTSMASAIKTEINRHEHRTKKLFDYYHGSLTDLQKHMQKNPADLKAFENLIWEWEGRRMPKKKVQTDWYSVVDDQIQINPEHYTEVKEYLKKEGIKPVVIDGFITVRKILDNVLVEADSIMKSDNVDQSDLQEFREYIGKAHNYFSHVREGDSYIQVLDAETKKTVYREHFYKIKERFLPENKMARARAEDWIKKQEGDRLDFIITRAKPVTKLPDEIFFQIPVEALDQISKEAGKGLKESRVKAEAERLMGENKDLDKDAAYKKARKILTTDIGRALAKAMSDVLKTRGWGKHSINRQNIPGFKKTDTFEVLSDYLTGYAGFATKISAAKEHSKTLHGIDAKKTPREYQYTSNYIRDMLANADATDKFVDRLRSLFFIKYLGGVVKSGMVNLTQNAVMAGPMLSQYTKQSHLKLAKAMRDVRRGVTGKKAWMGEEIEYKNLSLDEQKALTEMVETGAAQDLFLRELKGEIPSRGWGKYVKKVIDKSGIFMQVAEKFNRASTGLAAYRVAMACNVGGQETKSNHDLSVEFAKKVIYDSHFLYGKSNLPAMFRGGDFRKIARASYTFRSFTHNYLDIMTDLIANQGTQGLKVAGRSMMNIMMIGGLTSIPFFKGLSEIIKWAQDDDDEDLLTEIRGKMPNKFTKDLITYGLLGAAGGIDLSGSLSIEVPTKFKELIGVPYSLYEDSMNMKKSIKAGNLYRATSETPFTPIVVRNAMRGIELYTRGQRTRGGKAINVPGQKEPRKITGVQAAKKGVLGLQPTDVSSGYKAWQATSKMKKVLSEKKRSWADKIANATIKRDFEKVQEIKLEIREWNKKAREEGKMWRIVNVEAMVKSRLLGPGFRTLPKTMRHKAKELYNAWD